ncbi:MAG: hypothetical protein GY762_01115 [Proteobacteria bacterium]|nr:hypothetical protein [Pseudomonadota bacterium]
MDFIAVTFIVAIAAIVIGRGWVKKAKKLTTRSQEDPNPRNTCHGDCTGCGAVPKNLPSNINKCV